MRYKVTLSYNGAHYYGWQTQHRGDSVEEALEAVLNGMHGREIDIVGSGRTDARVHACGQVFHFDSDLNIACEAMQCALNSQLPKDIRIVCVEVVSDDFHARFDATRKRYEYVLTNDVNNPFVADFMALYKGDLDIVTMRQCASLFVGTHDFTSFTSARTDDRKDKVRTIYTMDIREEENTIRFVLEGDGFLRYMVRMLVQTLIEAGKHKLTYDEVAAMLAGASKHLCRFKAPPQGLYLMHVIYD